MPRGNDRKLAWYEDAAGFPVKLRRSAGRALGLTPCDDPNKGARLYYTEDGQPVRCKPDEARERGLVYAPVYRKRQRKVSSR